MNKLTSREIEMIDAMIGSSTMLATATGAEVRATPASWIRGDSEPDDAAMERLIVIKEVLDIVKKRHGSRLARLWFLSKTCDSGTREPFYVIRDGRYDEVRRSAINISPKDLER